MSIEVSGIETQEPDDGRSSALAVVWDHEISLCCAVRGVPDTENGMSKIDMGRVSIQTRVTHLSPVKDGPNEEEVPCQKRVNNSKVQEFFECFLDGAPHDPSVSYERIDV
jgi:hypothetical protein